MSMIPLSRPSLMPMLNGSSLSSHEAISSSSVVARFGQPGPPAGCFPGVAQFALPQVQLPCSRTP
jgi:hypothetical protein